MGQKVALQVPGWLAPRKYRLGMLAIYGPTRGFAMMKRSANGNGALCPIHFVDFWGKFDDFIVLVIV